MSDNMHVYVQRSLAAGHAHDHHTLIPLTLRAHPAPYILSRPCADPCTANMLLSLHVLQ